MTVRLILYSRPGCHLCDDMLSALQELDQEQELQVSVVNIDDDPALRNTYARRIPVLVRADTRQILCESRLDEAAVMSCLSS